MGRKSFLGMLIAAAAVAAGFVLIVLPLFLTGPEDGDLTGGNFPATTAINQPIALALGVDNTGSSAIPQICISATFNQSVQLKTVLFQNVDLITFTGNVACGGALSPGESTNVVVTFVPTQAGPLQASFRLLSKTATLGTPLTGEITVTS